MISIIIPAFNAEKTIGECIDSLKAQNYKGNPDSFPISTCFHSADKPQAHPMNKVHSLLSKADDEGNNVDKGDYEIIVVDDGSSDKTVEICKEKNVKLFEQKHAGPAKARNLGAKEALGEIIIFTDSDCIADSGWLLEMVKPFEDKKVVGVQGAYKTKQKEIIARFVQIEIEDRYEKMRKSFEKTGTIDFIATNSAAYRREIFLKEGGFDETFPMASGEDTDLSYRLAEKGMKMVFNPDAVIFHTHPSSLVKYLKVKFYRAFWRKKLYQIHKDKIIKDSYTPQVLKFQILFFYLFSVSLFGFFFNYKLALLSATTAFSLILLSSIPFTYFVLKKDMIVGFLSPFIVFLRSAVFGLGLIFSLKDRN